MSTDHDINYGLKFGMGLCLAYTIGVSCVRGWLRRGAYGTDDILTFIAVLFSFGLAAAYIVALSNGLGMPWTKFMQDPKVVPGAATSNLTILDTATEASIFCFTGALYFLKSALIAFLARIAMNRSKMVVYKVANGVLVLTGALSLVVVLAACPSATYYWAFYANSHDLFCSDQSVRWHIFTALDVGTEALLLLLPVCLVMSSCVLSSSTKVIMIIAFSLRLPLVGLSAVRNHYTHVLSDPAADANTPGLAVLWLQIHLSYALTANTILAPKMFLGWVEAVQPIGPTHHDWTDFMPDWVAPPPHLPPRSPPHSPPRSPPHDISAETRTPGGPNVPEPRGHSHVHSDTTDLGTTSGTSIPMQPLRNGHEKNGEGTATSSPHAPPDASLASHLEPKTGTTEGTTSEVDDRGSSPDTRDRASSNSGEPRIVRQTTFAVSASRAPVFRMSGVSMDRE